MNDRANVPVPPQGDCAPASLQPSPASPIPPGSPLPSEADALPDSIAPADAAVPAPVRRWWQTLGWLLAGLSVAPLFVLSMALGMLVYIVAVGLIDPTATFGSLSEAALSVAGQLGVLAVALPWWLRVRRRGFGRVRAAAFGRRNPRQLAGMIAAIVAAGIGAQFFLGYVLGFILQFMPEVSAAYEELMEQAGVSEFSLMNLLSVAVLAPVIEEMTCRGLMFEFFLRAVEPRWNKAAGAAGIEPGRGAVAFALVFQAAMFALLHMDAVQSSYALLFGLFFGWVYWRTGSLWFSIGLHLVVNASSYLVDAAAPLLDPLGYLGRLALTGAVFAVGIWLLARALRPSAPARP